MPIDAKLGYVRLDKEQIMENIKQYWINEFSSDIDLTDGSNAGAFANVMAKIEDDFDAQGQAIRDSSLLLKSNGQALDDICADEGVYRKVATNASVQLTIRAYVDPNSPTVITPDNGEYSTADGQVFRITDTVTISTPANNTDGTPMVDEDNNPLGMATVNAVSEDTGSTQNVAPNSIVNPEQSVDGFYDVTNNNKAEGGLDVESDEKLKTRALSNRLAKPNNTIDGLTTALRNLDDVKDARVISNPDNANTDSFGNPPKSTHAYVLGGQPNEIAQALYAVCAPDTNWVGKLNGIAYGVDGKGYQINYDSAPQALIYIKVSVKTEPTSFNTEYGTKQINDAINSYFDSLSMGDSVNFTKLFSPIYSVSGVIDATVAMGRDNVANVQPNQSINVGEMEVPVIANIDVEVS